MPRITRIRIQRFLPYLLLIFVSGCASGPRTFSISESELQSRMTEELAVPITLLKIFDVNLTNPVIKLDENTERMSAQLDTKINNPLNGEALTGKINISGKLRFDSEQNAVMLYESRIEQLKLSGPGMEEKYSDLFNVLAAKLGGDILDNVPLYTLKEGDLKVGAQRYTPSAFKIVGRDLRITLLPQ